MSTLPDGAAALCNVVNDTKEQQNEICMQLSPPSHWEARFWDSVPDLPDEVHVKIAVDSNVLLMDNLATAEVWQWLPSHTEKESSMDLAGS